MPANRVHGLATERNRNKRRDKKIKKKKTGMRVDDGARKLAQIKRQIVKDVHEYVVGTGPWPGKDPYNGRSRPD